MLTQVAGVLTTVGADAVSVAVNTVGQGSVTLYDRTKRLSADGRSLPLARSVVLDKRQ